MTLTRGPLAETNTDDQFVTRRTAAGLLGCSVDTIKRRQRSGAYPGAVGPEDSITGQWLIPVSQLALPKASGQARHLAGADDTPIGPVATRPASPPATAAADTPAWGEPPAHGTPPAPPANPEAIALAIRLLAVLSGEPR